MKKKEFESIEDKIVWLQMLEKITLQENAINLINKIRKHFSKNSILTVEEFNNYVMETSKEIEDLKQNDIDA